MTIAPRHPRVLHAGPRIRLFEALLVVLIIVVFLALFVAWMTWKQGHLLFAALVAGGVIVLILRQLVLIANFRRLKRLGLTGIIARAHITEVRRRRLSGALRADGTLPRGGLPFFRGLEVRYEFIDDIDRRATGRFLTTVADAPYYSVGDLHEVFYLPDDPSQNVSSLVLRWYWRLGGPAMVDEAPEEDFPLDEDVIVEELM